MMFRVQGLHLDGISGLDWVAGDFRRAGWAYSAPFIQCSRYINTSGIEFA